MWQAAVDQDVQLVVWSTQQWSTPHDSRFVQRSVQSLTSVGPPPQYGSRVSTTGEEGARHSQRMVDLLIDGLRYGAGPPAADLPPMPNDSGE